MLDSSFGIIFLQKIKSVDIGGKGVKLQMWDTGMHFFSLYISKVVSNNKK
jgi:hypothetical protein